MWHFLTTKVIILGHEIALGYIVLGFVILIACGLGAWFAYKAFIYPPPYLG